ncbi:MAG: TonB-dependent receptor [Candidatus Solibacter sp.]
MRHIKLFPVLALLAAGSIQGSDNASDVGKIKDLGLEALLEVRAVSAVRHDQKQLDSPRDISVISGDELRRKNFRTVPEALNEVVGILVQETNYAGGSPILRGMVGNRILILVDGVRLNSGYYRLGPNQYLNTIDIGQVERIEVIRGPGSALYGSDALGGIIHIFTKTPRPEEPGRAVSGELFTRLSSADHGISSRARMTAGWNKLTATGGVGGNNFGDLQPGGSAPRVRDSGYSELDGDMRFVYAPDSRQRVTFSLARVHQSDVCRTDVMLSGANLEYCWDGTRRDIAHLDYRLEHVSRLVNWVEIQGRYQTQWEDLNTVASASPAVRSHYFDRTRTRGVTLEAGTTLSSHHVLTYGADLDFDSLTSSRQDHNSLTGVTRGLPGNVPNGSTYANLAAFLQDEIRIAGPLSLNLGGRYSTVSIRGLLSDPGTGALSIDNHLHDLTGDAFLSLAAGSHTRLYAGFSQGFRAPNINDEGFLGVSGPRLEVPNPALRPEKSNTWECGVKFAHRRFSGAASYFFTQYRGLIDRAASRFGGHSFLDLNGNGVQDQGELNVYQRANIGRAQVYGGTVEGEWRIVDNWSLYGNLAWTRGDDTANHTPLTRIPPMKGVLGQRWRRRGGSLWAEAYTIVASAQRRLSPADRSDTRIRQGGTPGFATANIRGGIAAGPLGTVTLALENLTNKNYRWHGSGIDAPGINLVLGITRSIP